MKLSPRAEALLEEYLGRAGGVPRSARISQVIEEAVPVLLRLEAEGVYHGSLHHPEQLPCEVGEWSPGRLGVYL